MTRELNLHFGELHSDNSINDKTNLFENYIPKCYKVKRILISLNCFSEYRFYHGCKPYDKMFCLIWIQTVLEFDGIFKRYFENNNFPPKNPQRTKNTV